MSATYLLMRSNNRLPIVRVGPKQTLKCNAGRVERSDVIADDTIDTIVIDAVVPIAF